MLLPSSNTIAKYVFLDRFNKLDGIYKLHFAIDFETGVADGVDVGTSFYVPAGLTVANYTEDWAVYKGDMLLKLQSVTDPDVVIFAPTLALQYQPDLMVGKYAYLSLRVNLGIFSPEDAKAKSWLVDHMHQVVQTVTGSDDAVEIFADEIVYLTNSEYGDISDARALRVSALSSHYSNLTKQVAANTRLSERLIATEEKLLQVVNELTATAAELQALKDQIANGGSE